MFDQDSRATALVACGVLLGACTELHGDSDVDRNFLRPDSGSSEMSAGGSAGEAGGGAGGSDTAPGGSGGETGEGGTGEIVVEQGGAAGSAPSMGSGGTGEEPPDAGAGGAPSSNGGSGGSGSNGGGSNGGGPSNGGSGPIIPPPIDSNPIECTPAEGTLAGLKLTPIVSGLGELTFITAAPGDDTRLYVLERVGRVRILENNALVPDAFLDLTPRVDTFNEEGLIGLAFHPDYAENGRLFVQYSSVETGDEGAQRIILSEFARSAEDPSRVDAASEQVLMVVEQPSDIHLGGMLAFGLDGFLYISRGDGGSHDSQELYSWLGKMLRIDVDSTSNGLPYGIPEGNMTGDDALPEIWSRGWRNPWRFSIDACTGDIYVGDVGEARREEIDFEPRNTPGRDYGWRALEGTLCYFEPGFAESSAAISTVALAAALPGADAGSCTTADTTPPVLEYEHDDFGCSVIGGYVYRGKRIAALRGTYLYTDFCSGNFGAFRIENGRAVDVREITRDINSGDITTFTSFGADNSGELYLTTYTGAVYRIDPD